MPKPVTFDKRTIMEKVTDLFWRQGYHATSMQDLVDETGLNRSSIYNSFGDKHSLFFEALKFYKENEQQKAFNDLLKQPSSLSAIHGFFYATIDFILQDTANRCCLFIKSGSEMPACEKDIWHFLEQNECDLREFFKTLLLKAQTNSELNKELNPDEIAAFLASSFQGLKVTGMVVKNRSQLEAIVRQTLSVLK